MRRLFPAALAALILAAGAHADDVVVPVTVRPGRLVLGPVAVAPRSSRATVTVVDARGNGQGWRILARTAGAAGRPVVVTGVDMRCGLHATCTLPRSTARYPIGLGRTRSAVVLGALRGTGMGTIVISLTFAAPVGPGAGLGLSVLPG